MVIVPEAATLLFGGGFPRWRGPMAVRAAQNVIYHLQRDPEDVRGVRFPRRILLCNPGTVDGAAYWPGKPDEYFRSVGTTQQAELNRYDAVIFF